MYANRAKFEPIVCAPFSRHDINSILDSLSSAKSPGFDNISNEMLKYSNSHFRDYLMAFLNKVLETGEVPKELNIGKCMLVFKVVSLHLIHIT